MDWVFRETITPRESYYHPPQSSPPPPPPQNTLGSKINPSILVIVVILAVIFFISGLLHIFVRYLLKPSNREPDDAGSATALQGQLRQLFHLHDGGVDQSFIDALPIFLYKAIIGVKDPFDCAVCLCEFEPEDKLRLLHKCSHAFHLDCIDTWLLSHSTCPLCRSSLLPDFPPSHCCSPIVFVLESGGESSREMAPRDSASNTHQVSLEVDLHENSQKAEEIGPKEESVQVLEEKEKVVPVKLGKFRNAEGSVAGGEGTSTGSSNLDQRRCFSMGSYEYVMDESSLLQVSIKPYKMKQTNKKMMNHNRRLAMSECDCHSRRQALIDPFRNSAVRSEVDDGTVTGKVQKKESFSVSKIWMRQKKDKQATGDSSRRAFSFRLPQLRRHSTGESKPNCSISSPRSSCEFQVPRWEKSGSEVEFDVETGSCNNSIGSVAEEAPSFARRTLLWIVGKQNRVGSHD